MNRKGRKSEPLGTPDIICNSLDTVCLNCTACFLSVRYDLNHSMVDLLQWYKASLSIKMSLTGVDLPLARLSRM